MEKFPAGAFLLLYSLPLLHAVIWTFRFLAWWRRKGKVRKAENRSANPDAVDVLLHGRAKPSWSYSYVR